jgi:hypothetical protein
MRMMRKSLALLAMVAAVGACSDDDNGDNGNGPSGTSFVRVVHASADAPNVDILLEDSSIATNVAFGSSTDYVAVPSGNRNLKIRATGGVDNILNDDFTLRADSSYTILVGNDAGDIETLKLVDDRDAPGAANIKLRLVHGAPSAGDVDVYVTAPGADITSIEPTLSSAAFGEASGYLELPAGDYQIRVTPVDSKTVVLDGGTLSLAAGEIQTVVALEADGGGEPFQAVPLGDEVEPAIP